MKKIIVTVIILGFVGFGIWNVISSDSEPVEGESRGLEVRDEITLNEATCSAAGGMWNPCGSACRTDPEAICIELCVEYCECKSDAQCPSGNKCGDYVDDIGVCL